MFSDKDWLTIGKLVSTQGLKGAIRVNPASDFPERFMKSGPRWLQKSSEEPRKIELISGRQIPGRSIYVITFKGINNRDSAESLIGQKLLIPSSSRPKLGKNEFHYLDLVGLEVKLKNNEAPIGEVKDLTNAGNYLLEVQLLQGKKILVPFVKDIVPEINIQDGWLTINPPPGLLDLEIVD